MCGKLGSMRFHGSQYGEDGGRLESLAESLGLYTEISPSKSSRSEFGPCFRTSILPMSAA